MIDSIDKQIPLQHHVGEEEGQLVHGDEEERGVCASSLIGDSCGEE